MLKCTSYALQLILSFDKYRVIAAYQELDLLSRARALSLSHRIALEKEGPCLLSASSCSQSRLLSSTRPPPIQDEANQGSSRPVNEEGRSDQQMPELATDDAASTGHHAETARGRSERSRRWGKREMKALLRSPWTLLSLTIFLVRRERKGRDAESSSFFYFRGVNEDWITHTPRSHTCTRTHVLGAWWNCMGR